MFACVSLVKGLTSGSPFKHVHMLEPGVQLRGSSVFVTVPLYQEPHLRLKAPDVHPCAPAVPRLSHPGRLIPRAQKNTTFFGRPVFPTVRLVEGQAPPLYEINEGDERGIEMGGRWLPSFHFLAGSRRPYVTLPIEIKGGHCGPLKRPPKPEASRH